jgi:hypothetical protein
MTITWVGAERLCAVFAGGLDRDRSGGNGCGPATTANRDVVDVL